MLRHVPPFADASPESPSITKCLSWLRSPWPQCNARFTCLPRVPGSYLGIPGLEEYVLEEMKQSSSSKGL
eukprot:1160590-Pelagomonas_calceolata.AAC.4